jgi:hypothetical protein
MIEVSCVSLPNFDHVGRLAECLDAAFGGNLHRRGRVGVLGDDVDALVDQRLGRVGFLARIKPGVRPRRP